MSEPERKRGDGWLFQQPGSRYWYMGYFVDGRQVRASTKRTDADAAAEVLRHTLEDVRRGEATPHEQRVTVGDLWEILRVNYDVNRRRSLKTIRYPFGHVLEHFGAKMKAIRLTTDRLERYVQARQREGAAVASINLELGLIGRAFNLAIRAKRLSRNRLPFLPKLEADPSRVRQGFFTRDEVDALCGSCTCSTTAIRARAWTPRTRAKQPDVVPCAHLPAPLADLVRFLFFSAWRVGEVRTLQWRDYDKNDRVMRLRPEHSKNRHARVLPLEGELATIIERRLKARRLDCPYIFHREGKSIGDFRKLWERACAAHGLEGRIVHDLRRSGVKHLINSGNDPHTVMAFSGHKTASMLRRYHIIALDDLRRAALRAAAYQGERSTVTPLRAVDGEPT